MTTRTATTGVDHRRITNPRTGNALRITRWAEGSTERSVYRVMDRGALVELGTVTTITVTGAGHVTIAWPTRDSHLREGITVESFRAGAEALDDLIDVQPITTYRLSPRKAMPASSGHGSMVASTEGETDGR